MTKVKAHPKKYIVQSFLLLIKQMKFKIYIRKLHWLPPGELQPPFFFAKTNTSCNCLGFPVSLVESTKYHPQGLLSTTHKECMDVRAYRHTVTWLPNFLGWIDYQIVLAMGLHLCALHAFVGFRYKFSCEITKLPLQHSADTSVSTWLTLDQNSTNMWLALNWHMDRYVGQHSIDMSTE